MSLPREGRLAGVDYGTVRVGIALSDPGQTLASPWERILRGTREADAARFRELVAEQQVVGFVVGLPVHTSGEESEKSREARQFGAWLSDATGVAVAFYDERFTSQEADALLRQGGMTRSKNKQRRDMIAAQILLASYLESSRHGAAPGDLS